MNSIEPHNLARPIRQRLFLLLLAALLVVVSLVILILLGSTYFFINRISNPQPPPRSGLAPVLEAYYEGHGSWVGVDVLLRAEPPGRPEMGRSEWKDSILLDKDGHILLDHGSSSSTRIGQLYQADARDVQAPLFSNAHEKIGILVSTSQPDPSGFIGMLLGPLELVAVSLAILTVLIGFLLTRRLITPLAEVIAAAHSVASGKLSTRVSVSGPDDLRALSDSFNQMAGALEKSDREQRELLTDIAHELRTPLSIMKGRLEGIADGIYPATTAQIKPVLDETRLMENLVEDLDMLARASSRQLHFNRESFRLEELAERQAASFAAEAAARNIRIELAAESALPGVVGDAQRTGQVIGNLLGNALRYIPEGGRVAVKVRASREGVELRVEDDGPGVPAEELAFIFDRLWRGEKSRSRAHGGAGLGLAIARQFVELQGGEIRAENLPGGGLCVAFWLPAEKQGLTSSL